MTDNGQQTEQQFDGITFIPQPTPAQFEIGRVAGFGMKPLSAKNDHLLVVGSHTRLKMGVVDICPGTIPVHNSSVLVNHHAYFRANNPAIVRFTFASDLVVAAPFTCRMDQLDAIPIDHA